MRIDMSRIYTKFLIYVLNLDVLLGRNFHGWKLIRILADIKKEHQNMMLLNKVHKIIIAIVSRYKSVGESLKSRYLHSQSLS